MTFVRAVVLGIVQGLTEFLPISSSAHLRIVPALLGWDDPGAAFTAVTQLGTMAAVLLYFRRRPVAHHQRPGCGRCATRRCGVELDARMGWYLIVGTIPIGIFGLAFNDQIETGARDLRLIGTTLIVRRPRAPAAPTQVGRRTKELDSLTSGDGVAIGLAQSMALVPGVSRSGATITRRTVPGLHPGGGGPVLVPAVGPGGRAVGRLRAGRRRRARMSTGVAPTVVATLLAFVVGYASIAWLLRWLVNHSTVVFVVYRVGLGASGAGVGRQPGRCRRAEPELSPPERRGRGRPGPGPGRLRHRARPSGGRPPPVPSSLDRGHESLFGYGVCRLAPARSGRRGDHHPDR